MTDPKTEPEIPEDDEGAGQPLVTPKSRMPMWTFDGIVWFPTGVKGWALLLGGALLVGLVASLL